MRITIVAACLFLVASVASAADLGSAKADGWLGERSDGYLGLVDAGAPADVKALMEEVNAKRRAKYGEIAASRDVSIDAVAAIAAKKVFDNSPAGTYLMDQSGTWKQK